MATEPVDVVAEDASASESDEDHSSLEKKVPNEERGKKKEIPKPYLLVGL